MEFARPSFALDTSGQRRAPRVDPRRFGRRSARATVTTGIKPLLSDDFKLFAMTFIAGFLFVSVLIG
jgi:hypothetical protein